MNEQQLPPPPESWLAEIHNPNTNERELSETGVAYYGSNWREVRKLYTSSQMHAYARAALAAQSVPAEDHMTTAYRMAKALADHLATSPAPAQEVMLNGLTEAETSATASVAGLSERAQVAPEKQAEIDAEIRAAEDLHSHAQQIDEPVFHLRSYGDVSASDLEHYAAKHIQTPKAQQAANWTDVRMELEAAGRDDLSRFVESATEPAQAQAPRAFRIPDQGTPWWQTAKDCGAWTDRQEGDVGYVHFGSTEALRVYTLKISEQVRMAEPLTVPHPGSEQASKAIDAELEARGWPTNTKNAARAGYEACRKLAGIGANSGETS